jgi:hypothetical protein
MFSEDVIDELRDRVRDVFTALDQQTRLAVESSMRQQLGIRDRMDIDPYRLFAARLYRTVHMVEEQWSYQRRQDDLRRRTTAVG